jgi:hypothetical protein
MVKQILNLLHYSNRYHLYWACGANWDWTQRRSAVQSFLRTADPQRSISSCLGSLCRAWSSSCPTPAYTGECARARGSWKAEGVYVGEDLMLSHQC